MRQINAADSPEFPNLYCDLGGFYTGTRYGREKNPLIGSGGTLVPDWKALIQEFPDRFLAAVDAVEPVHYDRLYGPAVRELKRALADLSPEVARKVAFGNAEGLLTQQTSPARGAEVVPTPTPVPPSATTIPIINAHECLPLSPETQPKFTYENIKRILAAKPASVKTCEFMTKEMPPGPERPPRMPRAPR